MRTLIDRVLSQGALALANFFVSIAAAHSLSTAHLASFFLAWTVETLWIAGLRTVVLPSLSTHHERVRTRDLLLIAAGGGVVVAVVVFALCASSLAPATALLLAMTPVTFGLYEIWRMQRALEGSGTAVLPDTALAAAGLCGFLAAPLLGHGSLGGSLLAVNVISITIVLGVRSRSQRDERVGIRVWMRGARNGLLTGTLEWGVFTAISLVGVLIMRVVGGDAVLAGVRLAETLFAPVVLLASSLPFMAAKELRGSVGIKWPKRFRFTVLILLALAAAWIIAVLVAPGVAIGLLVGEHVAIAREAVLGGALGTLLTIYSTAAALMMRKRKLYVPLAKLRLVELGAAPLLVGAGSLFGTPLGASLGVSAYQAIPAVAQAVLLRRRRALSEDQGEGVSWG
jgi:hypothetical protein